MPESSARPQLITRAAAVAAGHSAAQIDHYLRAGVWRQCLRGIYLTDADCRGEVPMRTAMAAALLAGGDDATLGFTAAAYLHGLVSPRPPFVIDVYLPRRRHRRQRAESGTAVPVRWRWNRLDADETTIVDGLRVTTAARTVADVLPALARIDAVCLLDAALAGLHVTEAGLAALADRVKRHRCARMVAEACALADRRAQSPLETRARLACTDAGVAPDALQYPVRDRHGQLLGVADMAWVRGGGLLVLECDGAAFHSGPRELFRDRHRQNDFVLARCTLLRATWADVMRPGYVATLVTRALREMEAKPA